MCPITINKALLLQEGILKFELSWTAVTKLITKLFHLLIPVYPNSRFSSYLHVFYQSASSSEILKSLDSRSKACGKDGGLVELNMKNLTNIESMMSVVELYCADAK